MEQDNFFVDITPGGAYFKIRTLPDDENKWFGYNTYSLGFGYSDVTFHSSSTKDVNNKLHLVIIHKKFQKDFMNVLCEKGNYILYSPSGHITKI